MNLTDLTGLIMRHEIEDKVQSSDSEECQQAYIRRREMVQEELNKNPFKIT